MAFQRGTFCGSSLRSLTSQIGWGVGQPSQLQLSLVDDVVNGDRFSPPTPGTPAYFSFGKMDFFGLFQKYDKRYGIDGNPVYDVMLIDPRELLDGCQVIIGSYRGSVAGVPNLVNAYGFWEDIGFGLSGSNEAGMPWQKIWIAIQAICNSPSGTMFGGPLTLNGVSYSLDLSQLPFPSASYRLGGTSISLMEAVAQICEDGGCDFFVRLVGYTIQVCTVSRRNQPKLGTIEEVIQREINNGAVPRASAGVEFRNEVTSSFVVGGPVTTLFQTNELKSFWGYDFDGFPIWSTSDTLSLRDNNGAPLTTFETEFMLLNASPVADILGDVRYACSTFEMQCAKGGYDTWSMYMLHNRPDIARGIRLAGVFQNEGETIKHLLQSDVTGSTQDLARLASEDSFNNSMRLYEFVRSYADDYMGRKFAVALPFIMRYQEDESLRFVSSYNVVDAGFLEEGSQPLGLSEVNEDQFRNPDGRFRCLMRYDTVRGVDTSNISPETAVFDGESLFVEANADTQILFDGDEKPYALVTLPGVLTNLPVQSAGDYSQLAALTRADEAGLEKAMKQEMMPFMLSPAVVYPSIAAVPLQSNIYTYGPWYASGAPGKVLFEQDPGLTPWDYGDFDTMHSAGSAKVSNAITNMQLSESGFVEIAGMPEASLGDVLRAGGPNITNIDVQVSPQGVTTTYRFQTYSPRFGVFNKGMGERLKRIGLASQNLRRSMRIAHRNSSAKNATIAVAGATKSFKQNAPHWKNPHSPHGLLVGHNFTDTDPQEPSENITRGSLQAATHADSVVLSHAGDDSEFQATAIMSYNGLFRPFSTNKDGSERLSSYETPLHESDDIPCLTSLNPFQEGHDIETFTYGDTFSSLNGFRNTPDVENSRLFSLRGPIVMTGWGFGFGDGKKYPSDDEGVTFAPKHMRKQERWKTGPIDLLWDDRRKTWTCHDIIRGQTIEPLPANGSGLFKVSLASGDSWELYVHNHFSQGVSGDIKCIAGYSAMDNRMYLIAADCPADED